MKIKSICFHAGGDNNTAILYEKMGQYLKSKYNIELKLYCFNKEIYSYMSDKGYECIAGYKYDKIDIPEKEKSELKDFFNSLNIMDFRQIYFTEFIFKGKNKTRTKLLIERVYKKIKLLREILNGDFKADIFIDFAGDEVEHNIYKIFAKLKGGRLLPIRETVFPDRLGFCENDLGIWTFPVDTSTNISIEQKKIIDDFVATYLEKKKVFWGSPQERDFKVEIKPAKLFSHTFHKEKWVRFFQRLKRYITKKKTEKVYDKLNKIKKVKYFYFPLHYPVDSQLVYRGRPFLNQIDFSLNLTNFLPEDTYLVVKEHPHARGAVPYKELKKLKKNDKIILLHPWVNSHDVLPESEAVMVINSTVALEALYHGIPVISFGKNYFTGHGLVEEFKEFYDLYKLYNWKPVLEGADLKNKLNQYLQKAVQYSYPVNVAKFLSQYKTLTEKDFIVFAESVIDYIYNKTKK